MADNQGISEYSNVKGDRRYQVRLAHLGRRYKWSGFVRKDEARNWYQDRKRDLREGRAFPTSAKVDLPPPVPTLEQIIRDYLITAQIKKNYGGEVTMANFWMDRLGQKAADAITPSDIDAARKHLLQYGLKRGPQDPATVNRYTSWLHHVFRLEIEVERLAKNPCRVFVRSAVRGGQKFQERPSPDAVWSDVELGRIEQELGKEGMLYPLLAILTGLRQDEQFALKKSAIDLGRRIGSLHDPKAGTNQIFHINDDAARIFEYFMAKSGDSPFVFPSPRWPMTEHMQGQHWYQKHFKPACVRAGIVLGRKDGKTWHTLRHSFADRLAELAVPILDIQEAGRWSSWQAMRRYVKKSNPRVSAAVQRLKIPAKLAHLLPMTQEMLSDTTAQVIEI